ncbi:MAG: osmoprotectant transport system substrate-binding protein [Chloroflexota bacterium]|jgi:osmoprotectant transport system substrate-binding protein|nr:osmoprotectant transport system substrate-binding protein [Chloroflexota bacterium]
MRTPRLLVLGSTLLVLLAACTSSGGASSAPSAAASAEATAAESSAPASAEPASAAALPPIRIGSDNFYESKLMGEIYAQVLEANGYTVERKFGLGSRQERIPTMDAGQIDLVPEYVGSGLGFYDKTKISGDGQANAAALQAAIASKGLTVLGISPGQDTNAFVVRKDTSDNLKLTKMSDLAAVQDQLKWGLPSDCDTNPLCSGALKDYGITYPPKQRSALGACDVPMATALQGKAIDLAELCSTQPAIVQFGFVTLEDDKHTQPAENIAPIVRDDYLAKVDKTAFAALLDAASAKMTTDELTKLGVEVAVNQKDVAEVAKTWLTAQGLVK